MASQFCSRHGHGVLKKSFFPKSFASVTIQTIEHSLSLNCVSFSNFHVKNLFHVVVSMYSFCISPHVLFSLWSSWHCSMSSDCNERFSRKYSSPWNECQLISLFLIYELCDCITLNKRTRFLSIVHSVGLPIILTSCFLFCAVFL